MFTAHRQTKKKSEKKKKKSITKIVRIGTLFVRIGTRLNIISSETIIELGFFLLEEGKSL